MKIKLYAKIGRKTYEVCADQRCGKRCALYDARVCEQPMKRDTILPCGQIDYFCRNTFECGSGYRLVKSGKKGGGK